MVFIKKEFDYLIWNENLVQKFCDTVVPALTDDEVLILLLAARKKYGGISRSQEILSRVIVKSNDHLINKIRKMAVVGDLYFDRVTGNKIPATSFAIYIDLAPKSTIKSYQLFTEYILQWFYQTTRDKTFDKSIFRKIDTKLFSAIHKSNSRTPYWIIDIDMKNVVLLNEILQIFDNDVVWITETHGGYHVIVNKNKRTGSKIYNLRKSKKGKENIEIIGKSLMTVVPGTYHGGFKVTSFPDFLSDVL